MPADNPSPAAIAGCVSPAQGCADEPPIRWSRSRCDRPPPRNIPSAVADELRPQSKIDVVQVGEEVSVQPAAGFKSLATIQHRSAASCKDRHRLVELPMVFVHAAQAERASCHQHGIARAIEMCALRGAQQFARRETKLRIAIERANQHLEIIRLQFDVVVQQQQIFR